MILEIPLDGRAQPCPTPLKNDGFGELG